MDTQGQRVSVHGGHSGQFCGHAHGTLEEIVQAYIAAGFSWVGISEHMPPLEERFIYPEEKEAGLSVEHLHHRFARYIDECRRLQKKYQNALRIFAAMETETYRGSAALVRDLVEEFQPDYLVGSVHHVDDMPFDSSPEDYDRVAEALGGYDRLYCRYFDQQYEMLVSLKPAVVGHFDIIRLYDPQYKKRLLKKEIVGRIERNLDFISAHNLILDFNLRSLSKGADEPYVSASILEKARRRGIAVVPGDDSHGVETIGRYIDEAALLLSKAGFSGKWQQPARL